MAFIYHYELNESEVLTSTSLTPGSLIYCKDSTNIYMVPTTGGKAVKMAETTKFLTEKERSDILTPINCKKYFCYDTGKMWIYYNDWICINPDNIDAKTLNGATLSTVLTNNEAEIPTSKAVSTALSNLTATDVGAVSYNSTQELTDDQRKQARNNISQLDWITFSDNYGTYTYALNPDSFLDYEVAKTITNTTGNGNVNAMDDIVSSIGILINHVLPEDSLQMLQLVVGNFDALVDGGAFTGNNTLTYYLYKECPEGILGWVSISEVAYNGATHQIYINGDNVVNNFYYNKDTNTIIERSNSFIGVDNSLTRNGYSADAKVVGDTLALKVDKSELVQSDWDEIDENSLAFIKNKPDIATDKDALKLLGELNLVVPVTTLNNKIITDSTDRIYIL